MFSKVIDRPTQRPGSISPSIVMEAENGHKPGDNVNYHAVLYVHVGYLDSGSCMGVVWIKTEYVGLLARYMKFAPMKISRNAVVAYLQCIRTSLCIAVLWRRSSIPEAMDHFAMIKVVSLVWRVIHRLL